MYLSFTDNFTNNIQKQLKATFESWLGIESVLSTL